MRHPIDPYCSQYHDLRWIDIDGDGACELVTGKRYRAHCGSDPGGADDVGIYYFKWTGEGFAKEVIDHGPPRVATGCGILTMAIRILPRPTISRAPTTTTLSMPSTG